MKRSEMVKKICELLETQAGQGTAYMFKSEQIMQLLEKNGMQPPNIRYNELWPESTLKNTDDHWYALWEEEDEA